MEQVMEKTTKSKYDKRCFMSLEAYKKTKVRLLKDFDITMDSEQKAILLSLKNTIQVDNYVSKLIQHRLDNFIDFWDKTKRKYTKRQKTAA